MSEMGDAQDSVRGLFLQLVGRLRDQRARQKDGAQMAVQAALARADEDRVAALRAPIRARAASLTRHHARFGAGEPVLCCSRCGEHVCRARDARPRAAPGVAGPELILADADPKRRTELVVRACNVRKGPTRVFCVRGQSDMAYEARAVHCPSCRLCLGAELVAFAVRAQEAVGWPASLFAAEPEPEGEQEQPFPSAIKRSALFGSPRVIRPSDAYLASRGVEDGAPGLRLLPVGEVTLCLRYLALRDAMSGALLGPAGQAVSCAGCGAQLCDTHQVLCTRRSWRDESGAVVNAFHVNALRDGCVKAVGERVEELAFGPFLLRELACASCCATVGYKFVEDRSPWGANEVRTGRYGLITARVALPDEEPRTQIA